MSDLSLPDVTQPRQRGALPQAQLETFERDSLRLTWAEGTTVGKVRRLNEDSLLASGGMFVVADGMGGHAAGDVASALTIDVCREFAEQLPLQLTDLERLVHAANARVRDHATSSGTDGMGTTLVGAVLIDNGGDDALAVVNVGDSRCYSWDDTNGLAQVTTDHSAVQELLDAGSITPAEAERHPERNVVTRAIGIEPAVAADFVVLRRTARQRLLLCSDGVSGPLGDERIEATLGEDVEPATVVQSLLDQVLDGPATDNATVIVIDIEWTGSALDGLDIDDADITGPRPTLPPPDRPASAGLIDTVPLATTPTDTDDTDEPARPSVLLSEVPT
jgi:PPM family protein phosphatase